MRKSNWLKGINQLFKFYQKKKGLGWLWFEIVRGEDKMDVYHENMRYSYCVNILLWIFFLFPRCFQREIVDSVHLLAVFE